MNKNKGIATIAILGIILGVLVVGGGAYYVGTSKNVEKEKIGNINNIENKEEDNQYLDYIENEQFGFQFKYSKRRFISEYQHGNKMTIYIEDCTSKDPECVTSRLAFIIEVDKSIKTKEDLKNYIYSPTKGAIEGKYYDCTNIEPSWVDGIKIDNENAIQLNRSICAGKGAGIKYPVPIIGTIYNNIAYIIGFDKGEYTGVEKIEFDNLVSSFKFIDVKDPNMEFFNGEPGEIKMVKEIMEKETRVGWNIDVDILSTNPKWTPGSNEDLYLNESKKIRKFVIDSKTETYECGNSVNGNIIPSIKNTLRYVESIKIGDAKSFYVTGSHVDKILDICLP